MAILNHSFVQSRLQYKWSFSPESNTHFFATQYLTVYRAPICSYMYMRNSVTSLECFGKKEKRIFDLDFPENRTVCVEHVSQRPYVNSIISLFECTVQEKKSFSSETTGRLFLAHFN